MPESPTVPSAKADMAAEETHNDTMTNGSGSGTEENFAQGPPTPYLSSTPSSPYLLSRNSSYLGHVSTTEDFGDTPPDKLTFFDIFENLALQTKFEKWQATLNAQREKVKKQQERLRTTGKDARNRAVAEWRKRVPNSEEQLAKYRSRMKRSVEELNKRWDEVVIISAKEKVSFMSAVLNIFLSGYIIGAAPELFYYWFTAQLVYFMPIRWYTYHRKGYHYFLADLCYFVNGLCMLSIWAFPRSKRLFIATWCLAYGNNAVAIIMWRNSLVFHSLDKVTSLFIHMMPPVALHCMVHLTPHYILQERFPAVYTIKTSPLGSPEHYSLPAMLFYATLPYAVWQFSYHFLITVARADKIAAGRPTSFTWLRRSYAKTAIGKFVISLPQKLQEPAFMMIQYCYALLTIVPCPIWFWYRWASAGFLLTVFSWSVWNGANYYMDVFGKQFQKELEQMKKEVAKWQNSPGQSATGMVSPTVGPSDASLHAQPLNAMEMMQREKEAWGGTNGRSKRNSLDDIPPLDHNGNPKSTEDRQARTTGASILDDSTTSNNASRR